MAAALQEALPEAQIELIADGAGIYNVEVDGTQYWNKHQKGGFPNEDQFVKYLVYKVKQQQQQQG